MTVRLWTRRGREHAPGLIRFCIRMKIERLLGLLYRTARWNVR